MTDSSTPAPAIVPAPGVCVTLWNGSRPDLALAPEVHDLLARARPDIVMVHAGPRALLGRDTDAPQNHGIVDLVANVRQLLPNVRVWLGVGCDGWTDYYAANQTPAGLDVAVGWLASTADLAASVRAELVMWDAEAASESHVAVGATIATTLIARVIAAHPTLLQGFTSYPIPAVHPRFPWAAWHTRDASGRGVVLTAPQCYVSEGGVMAAKGALDAMVAWSDHAMATAVANGLVPTSTMRGLYLQAHSTPAADTIRAACAASAVAFWGAPECLDHEGATAILATCELRRQGYLGVSAVRRYQHDLALHEDDDVGVETLASLGIAA